MTIFKALLVVVISWAGSSLWTFLMYSPSPSNGTIQFLAELLSLGDHEDIDRLDPFHRISTTSHPRNFNK